MKGEYFEGYFRGQLKSDTSNEEWKYENGKVVCNSGKWSGTFDWDGTTLTPNSQEKSSIGSKKPFFLKNKNLTFSF